MQFGKPVYKNSMLYEHSDDHYLLLIDCCLCSYSETFLLKNYLLFSRQLLHPKTESILFKNLEIYILQWCHDCVKAEIWIITNAVKVMLCKLYLMYAEEVRATCLLVPVVSYPLFLRGSERVLNKNYLTILENLGL